MNQTAGTPIHSLEIPTTSVQLLVPSASVAEVANVGQLTPLPQAPVWVAGLFGWRLRAIPVISFETMVDNTPPWIGPKSKILIFFPIPGRKETDFFGILSASEPQPHQILTTDHTPAQMPKESPFIAGGINLRGRVVAIPNMAAMGSVFYRGI